MSHRLVSVALVLSTIFGAGISLGAAELTRSPMVVCTREDRKSTRLNSSHSQISYAVFCLKKKKKIIDVYKVCRYLNHFSFLRIADDSGGQMLLLLIDVLSLCLSLVFYSFEILG